MAKRPAKPSGASWLSPYLTVKDVDAALDFYQRAFGFEKRMSMPGPDGRTMHAELIFRDIVILLGPEGNQCPSKAPVTTGIAPPIGLYLYCEDVDKLVARATAAGATAASPPQDMFWGDRVCQLRDPNGYTWNFATNVGDFDPSKMPK
jgi:PhnB protein